MRMRMFWKRIASVVCLGLVVSLSCGDGVARGQAPAAAAQAAPPQVPAVRVATRLVQVSTIVTDGKGQPIGGLSRENFELLDNGKAQTISEFAVEDFTASRAAVAHRADLFSNRVADNEKPARTSVILMDSLNTRHINLRFAQTKLLDFIKSMSPPDHVAIFELADGLKELHDFTNNSAELFAKFEKYEAPQPTEFLASQSGVGPVAAHYMRVRREETVHALRALARFLGGIPGRKNLVWISSTFVSPSPGLGFQTTLTDEIGAAVQSLTDANVAVYPVDAGGSTTSTKSFASITSMNELAELTGGKAFYNTNDIGGAARAAVEDERISYVLGYYPEHSNWDNKFHEIKVKVNVRGAEVRARHGYFARVDAPPPSRDKDKRVPAVVAAADNPLDATSLGLNVEVHSTRTGGEMVLETKRQVPATNLRLEQDGDHWTDAVDFYYLERDGKEKPLGNDGRTVNLNLTQSTREPIMKDGVRVDWKVKVDAGAATIRSIARDVIRERRDR